MSDFYARQHYAIARICQGNSVRLSVRPPDTRVRPVTSHLMTAGGSFFSNCGPFYRNPEIAVSSKLAYPGKIDYIPVRMFWLSFTENLKMILIVFCENTKIYKGSDGVPAAV